MSEWARVLDTPLGANGADGRLVVAGRPVIIDGRGNSGQASYEWGVVFYRGVNKRAAVKVAALGSDELKAAAESNPEIERRQASGPMLDYAVAQALDRAPGDAKTRQVVLYIEGRLAGGGIPF